MNDMVKISIIVPVYNVKDYLEKCLNSLVNQTLTDIEIIVIDDASSDGCKDIIKKYAIEDARFVVRILQKNAGTLNARIIGTEQATGRYIMYVDSDDTLELEACEELYQEATRTDVDVLHFGTNILAENGVSANMRDWVEHFLTPYSGELSENLIESCFIEERFDFNITNKIWKSEICKKAFCKLQNIHLIASEDRYIFFVLMYYAKNYYGVQKKYYNYRLGVGVTGGDILSLELFEKRCSGVKAAHLVHEFLKQENKIDRYQDAEKLFLNRIIWDCVDCWHNKLCEKDQKRGFEILRKYFTPNQIVNAFARVYFEEMDDIFSRMQMSNQGRVGIYYRYLGYQGMDFELAGYMKSLRSRGLEVILFTDQDADIKENIYGADIVRLPNSVDANWDKYEERGNVFYRELLKNKIDNLLYLSPTSHIYKLDTLLAELAGVKIFEMNDEIYKNKAGEMTEKMNEMTEEMNILGKRADELENLLQDEREKQQGILSKVLNKIVFKNK